ncbi:MAG: hypothetical protein J7604_16610 [Sporocytophaga sp.]|uniref:hypothetical protein n=1 Tax=Sporocytophaga sp. TaxID=2231183 RepID=UPI001B0D25B4|nr:hypothetical protein [Sporocytophaga sp.]MBO9701831.1 hypothetical protein [Sporocytophaga sp.]
MKPEEIDRLFRNELEKLDQVPGVEWNETGAWEKLKIQLKGGWSSSMILTVSIIVITAVMWLVYIVSNHKDAPIPQNHHTAKQSLPAKVDSINKKEEKKAVHSTKKFSKVNRLPVKEIDTIAISATDTTVIPLPQEELKESNKIITTILRKDKGIKLPSVKSDFNFEIPEQSVLRMKVNNQFNISNLIKSIEAGKNAEDNFYYYYEYDKNFIPPPFENTYKKNNLGKPQIITNFIK